MNTGEQGNGITSDASGNVLSVGYFKGTSNFTPQSTTSLNKTSIGGKDIFLILYDSSGFLQQAETFGASGND